MDRRFPIPLASANNQRSFIYLGNLIDAIVTCINHPKAADETFLICDGEKVSTPELIKKIATALGKSARLFHIPLFLMKIVGKLIGKSAAIDRLIGTLIIDHAKFRKKLGWKPPYTMEHGLRETAKWFAESL